MNLNLSRYIILALIFSAIIYIVLALYGDFDLVVNSFQELELAILPILFFLSLLNYISRFLKWHYYLKILNIHIALKDSAVIFFSGLVMSITPARIGELLKPYFVKKINTNPMAETIPVLFAERLTDFLGMIFLSLFGAFVFQYGKIFLVVILIVIITLIVMISNRALFLRIFSYLERLTFLSKFLGGIKQSYESAYLLLKPKPLFSMVLLSALSWFFECVAFFLLLNSFNTDVSLLWSTFVYAFSTIAGALTFLPGGLGVTEGSLTLLIQSGGFAPETSVLVTFVIRIATLWFAVLLGAFSLFILQKRLGTLK